MPTIQQAKEYVKKARSKEEKAKAAYWLKRAQAASKAKKGKK